MDSEHPSGRQLQTAPEDSGGEILGLLEAGCVAFVAADHEGHIQSWNGSAERLFGYAEPETSGLTLAQLVEPESRVRFEEYLDNLAKDRIESGGPPLEWRVSTRSGDLFEACFSIGVLGAGDELRYLALVTDASAAARGALLKSESFFRAVYDASDDIMVLTDEQNQIVWSNAAWYRGLGYAPGEQQTPFENVHDGDRDRVQFAWSDFIDGRADFQDVVYRYKRGDNGYAYLETTIRTLPGHPYFYLRSRNITEKRFLQDAQQEKATYLEVTLAVSQLLLRSVDTAGIADYIKGRLNFLDVHLTLFRYDPAGLALFADYPGLQILPVGELRNLLAKAHDLEETGSPEEPAPRARAADLQRAILFLDRSIEKDAAAAVATLTDTTGDKLGALLLAVEETTMSPHEMDLARNLVNTLSLVIERRHHVEEMAIRVRMEKARADFGNALLSCAVEADALQLAIAFFSRSYGVESATLLTHSDRGLEFVKGLYDGQTVDLRGARIRRSADNPIYPLLEDSEIRVSSLPGGRSIFEGVVCDRPRVSEYLAGSDSLRESGRETLILRIPGVGVIVGYRSDPLCESDREACTIVLNMVSVAVRELRMEEVQARNIRKNEMLHHLELELRQIPMGRWREKLQIIAGRLAQVVGAARVSILLSRKGHGSELRAAASYQGEDAVGGVGSALHRHYYAAAARHAYRAKTEIFVSAPISWEDVTDLPQGLKDKVSTRGILPGPFPAFYAGPIRGDAIREDQTDGVLYVVCSEPFASEDFSILHDLSNLITSAVKDELVYKRESELATKDELTKLYNRRYFLRRATDWFKVSQRYGKSCALILLDIDHFKSVNDSYGHECGDLTLVELARIFRTHLREVDIPARYGGEEFIILLPETGLDGAHNTAERIRVAVANNAFDCGGHGIRFTVSCGVVCCGENAQEFEGERYSVVLDGGELMIAGPGIDRRPLGLRFDEATVEKVSQRLEGLSDPSLSAAAVEHLSAVAARIMTLEGMVSVADARLYRSKELGRNQVTSAYW